MRRSRQNQAEQVENPAEQALIRWIVEQREAGATYRAIADRLNGQGKATKNGGEWSPKVVRGIYLRHAEAAAAGVAE